jgi:hypothetical protein
MVDSSKLTKNLTGAIQKDGHALDMFVRKVVSSMLSEFCIPWLVSCLEKYSEDDFHKRMNDQMFDFINDWQTNHHKKFKAFMIGARRMRHAYDFNSEIITARVVVVLTEHGWTIYENEYIRLYHTMQQLKNLIES